MNLYLRLLGQQAPTIDPDLWSGLFAAYKFGDMALTEVVDPLGLSDKSQTITAIFPATDKIGLNVGHTWLDKDPVFVITTEQAPAGIGDQVIRYVVNSNPTVGTIKVSDTEDGDPIDITDEGLGQHVLRRVDKDVGHYDRFRLSITAATNAERKLRRVVWDIKVKDAVAIGRAGFKFISETSLRTQIENLSVRLSS